MDEDPVGAVGEAERIVSAAGWYLRQQAAIRAAFLGTGRAAPDRAASARTWFRRAVTAARFKTGSGGWIVRVHPGRARRRG